MTACKIPQDISFYFIPEINTGIRFVNISLPAGNDRLEYLDIEGNKHEIFPLPADTLKILLANTQDDQSYAQPGDFDILPVFFENNDPEADLDTQLSLYPQERRFKYRGTTVTARPNPRHQGWIYSGGYYINPKVPRYIFTGPLELFSSAGDIPFVISDLVGMVVTYESQPDRTPHPREPWVWIAWKDENTLDFCH